MVLRGEFALVVISLTLLVSINMVGASSIPMRGGCFRLSSEIPVFRLQGEAVVLRCSFLERYLFRQGFSQDEGAMRYLRVDGAGREDSIPMAEGLRVQEQTRRLWFLPAQAADSGTYSCVFRNASYCCASNITLQVYEARQPHLDNISYPMFAFHGRNMKLSCHHINEFNISGNLKWYKEATAIALSTNRTRYHRETNTSLTIQNVATTDEGTYTCRLQIVFNTTEYTVSRVIKLSVRAPERRGTLPSVKPTASLPSVKPTASLPSVKPTASLPSVKPSHSSVKLERLRPKIIAPVNGTIFQTAFGSGLLIMCAVSSGNQSADSTEVTWLLNGQTVSESFLGGRVLLGEKRVTAADGVNYIELRLIFLEVSEEDTMAEIKCVAQNPRGREEVVVQVRLGDSLFTWLIVAAAGTICFLTVVCLILCQLLKSKQKVKDYILARQDSTF
ncbi:interleukin-1 receptor type 2 [Conger conger]|uniref:interleukin-1 receptor type 2 n=1 Tax=Conger conger TaxID=82655 RepID=UPI002A5A1E22|nr:interleukin-1 receptor type 2 [Conger conger]